MLIKSSWLNSSLKLAFLTLVALDLNKEMRVEADALEYTIGGVLSMRCKDKNGGQ